MGPVAVTGRKGVRRREGKERRIEREGGEWEEKVRDRRRAREGWEEESKGMGMKMNE